jgi:hypothetical protein
MALVDTVIRFGVTKALRFGQLQHPITLTSQMATSAMDRKATGGILRCGQNCSHSVFVACDRAALQHPRQIFFNWAVVRTSSAINDLTFGAAALFIFAGTEARLPSGGLLAGRCGYCLDLLFFRLPGLPITLLLAFGHAHCLSFDAV